MGKLFGTDGIRGKANRYPITAEMAVRIGRAAALFFKKGPAGPRIVLANDSRISGDMLLAGLAAGICAEGMDAVSCGILPTPGVAWVAGAENAAAGISVSASHNPYDDNGIKFFSGDGFKLSRKNEDLLEELILNSPADQNQKDVETGRVHAAIHTADRYAGFLAAVAPELSLKGARIVLDCANGAASRIAPDLFAGIGADIVPIFNAPDGRNINAGCGSEHPQILQRKVVESGAHIGIAFDGDADRLTAVDETGAVLTGDQVLAICAEYMRRNGTLRNNLVVSTVMSNIGLGLALSDMGVRHIMTDVGDREVMQEMRADGAVLGGEDSGHLIFFEHHTTGDGMLSALQLLRIIKATSEPLSRLSRIMMVFPQTLINVEVKQKSDLKGIDSIQDSIRAVEKKLGNRGRVLVRYSGTQPLCRIMVEGPTVAKTQVYCRELADAVRRVLG